MNNGAPTVRPTALWPSSPIWIQRNECPPDYDHPLRNGIQAVMVLEANGLDENLTRPNREGRLTLLLSERAHGGLVARRLLAGPERWRGPCRRLAEQGP